MDNLFHAINNGFLKGVKRILKEDDGSGEICGIHAHQDSFCAGMTPFALAAHKNNYEILEFFFEKGYRLLVSNLFLRSEVGLVFIFNFSMLTDPLIKIQACKLSLRINS